VAALKTETQPRSTPHKPRQQRRTPEQTRLWLVSQGATENEADSVIEEAGGHQHVGAPVALARFLVNHFGGDQIASRLAQNQLLGAIEQPELMQALADLGVLLPKWRIPKVPSNETARNVLSAALTALETGLVSLKAPKAQAS
jgi:hypothetical protein